MNSLTVSGTAEAEISFLRQDNRGLLATVDSLRRDNELLKKKLYELQNPKPTNRFVALPDDIQGVIYGEALKTQEKDLQKAKDDCDLQKKRTESLWDAYQDQGGTPEVEDARPYECDREECGMFYLPENTTYCEKTSKHYCQDCADKFIIFCLCCDRNCYCDDKTEDAPKICEDCQKIYVCGNDCDDGGCGISAPKGMEGWHRQPKQYGCWFCSKECNLDYDSDDHK